MSLSPANTNEAPSARNARLYEIERTLKFDPYHPYRREMVAEYVALTSPETKQ